MGLGRVKGSIAQIARGKMRRAHELVYAINFEKDVCSVVREGARFVLVFC